MQKEREADRKNDDYQSANGGHEHDEDGLSGEVVAVEVTMVHGGEGVTTWVDGVAMPWSSGSAAEQR